MIPAINVHDRSPGVQCDIAIAAPAQKAVQSCTWVISKYCHGPVIGLLMPLQVRQLAPGHMKRRGGRATSMHVTCAMFSRQCEIVATYNDEASVCTSL